MRREATLATSLVIDFLGFLERQGHPLTDVCRTAGIDPDIVRQPNSRVPAACMERLWPLAVQLTGDPDVGLHSAESYNPWALSIVGDAGRTTCRFSAVEEQTSYRQLVDEVRKSLTIEHLSPPGTSATDVAFLLGFSEPSALTRAFLRWTGTAPTEFRAASA